MKKNRKIIPAILLIATTAFASFACKNKADTKPKPVDNETAFEAYNSASEGMKTIKKYSLKNQIYYKSDFDNILSITVDSTTFDVDKGIYASAQSESGDYTFLKCAEKADDTYNVVRKSSRFESGMGRHYGFANRLRCTKRNNRRLFYCIRNMD